jgi:hypothetical protein
VGRLGRLPVEPGLDQPARAVAKPHASAALNRRFEPPTCCRCPVGGSDSTSAFSQPRSVSRLQPVNLVPRPSSSAVIFIAPARSHSHSYSHSEPPGFKFQVAGFDMWSRQDARTPSATTSSSHLVQLQSDGITPLRKDSLPLKQQLI